MSMDGDASRTTPEKCPGAYIYPPIREHKKESLWTLFILTLCEKNTIKLEVSKYGRTI
jgi:hypothetical protein